MLDDPKKTYVCRACAKDWTAESQPNLCPHCHETGGERSFPTLENAIIAAQNDLFRKALCRVSEIAGKVMLTPGVLDYGDRFVAKLFNAVQQFDAFTEDNDPYQDHSFGTVEIKHIGKPIKVYWKIDLYDLDLTFGSPAPADLTQTMRVLTLLLPSEY